MKKFIRKLEKNNIKCRFRITNVHHNEKEYEGIIYNEFIEYSQILEEIQEYDCILEIVQPGQVGVTLRYYEAVVYNKKLITNNQFVKTLPFYDSRFMFVYDDIEDIDVEWIKSKVRVDYNYSNEFSPVKLIEDIKKRVNGGTIQ